MYLLLEENQRFRDSSSVLDTFYLTYHDSAFAQLIRINLAFRTDSLDSATIEAKIRDVNAITASNIRDENMKTVNRIYLKYFTAMNFAVDSADSVELKAVADQCYIEGGSAVIEARSLYYSLTGNFTLNVDTNCPGSMFKNEQEAVIYRGDNYKQNYIFKIYPNPVSANAYIVVLSSEEGEIMIADNLGRTIARERVNYGYTKIDLSRYSLPTGIYHYQYRMIDKPEPERGKIIIVE